MRVITGKAKGHKLKAPSGNKTRPTTDKVKESIFNIIGQIDSSAYILDLFAGSGSMGIEFLSRGGKKCFFIDMDSNAIRVIKQNLQKTKLKEQAEVYKTDVIKAIKKLGSRQLKFDFVFMDPPYGKLFVVSSLEQLIEDSIIKTGCIVIVEHSSDEKLPSSINKLHVLDCRKYGDTFVTFYEMKEENNDCSISR